MTRPSPKKPAGPEKYDRRDLVKAFQDVVQDQEKRAGHAVEQQPGSRWGFWGIALVLLGASLGSLVLHPEWFFPQERVETAEVQDASLRLSIYREILHVEQFRRTNGRLPADLQEAGGGDSGVEYVVNGGGYQLTGRSGTKVLTYDSSTSASAFVGDSYEKIRRRTS